MAKALGFVFIYYILLVASNFSTISTAISSRISTKNENEIIVVADGLHYGKASPQIKSTKDWSTISRNNDLVTAYSDSCQMTQLSWDSLSPQEQVIMSNDDNSNIVNIHYYQQNYPSTSASPSTSSSEQWSQQVASSESPTAASTSIISEEPIENKDSVSRHKRGLVIDAIKSYMRTRNNPGFKSSSSSMSTVTNSASNLAISAPNLPMNWSSINILNGFAAFTMKNGSVFLKPEHCMSKEEVDNVDQVKNMMNQQTEQTMRDISNNMSDQMQRMHEQMASIFRPGFPFINNYNIMPPMLPFNTMPDMVAYE